MSISRVLFANVCSELTNPNFPNTDNDLHRFPLADVLWTLAMAVNVFLIVFYKYEAEDLRKLEKWYISIITTLVFLPALTFLFIHTTTKGPMYGSVTVRTSQSNQHIISLTRTNHSSGARSLPPGYCTA
jgi:hypothetical protein